MPNQIIHSDCLEILRTLPSDSVDSVVTDPPYGLSKEPDITEVLTKWLAGEPYDHGHGGFMGKAWDSFVPHPDVWKEVFRVLKPGGHALVFAGTRTQDLMTIALRLGGFEIRDAIAWLYFSGFPKSMDVSKAFDKREDAHREVLGPSRHHSPGRTKEWGDGNKYGTQEAKGKFITAPATDLAKQWDGWGTALKPAHEPIIVARKPLIGTVADNVEKYGTGGINIDGCRIPTNDKLGGGQLSGSIKKTNEGWNRPFMDDPEKLAEWCEKTAASVAKAESLGRFPANCITTDEDAFYSHYFNVSPPEVSKKASKKDRNADWTGAEIALDPTESRKSGSRPQTAGSCPTHARGLRTGESSYPCGCPLAYHDREQVTYLRNSHPTVKPKELMAWLIRLVTPPGGTVLDPFAGSGSTLVAAKREGFDFIGIERELEYVEIARARTMIEKRQTKLATIAVFD